MLGNGVRRTGHCVGSARETTKACHYILVHEQKFLHKHADCLIRRNVDFSCPLWHFGSELSLFCASCLFVCLFIKSFACLWVLFIVSLVNFALHTSSSVPHDGKQQNPWIRWTGPSPPPIPTYTLWGKCDLSSAYYPIKLNPPVLEGRRNSSRYQGSWDVATVVR